MYKIIYLFWLHTENQIQQIQRKSSHPTGILGGLWVAERTHQRQVGAQLGWRTTWNHRAQKGLKIRCPRNMGCLTYVFIMWWGFWSEILGRHHMFHGYFASQNEWSMAPPDTVVGSLVTSQVRKVHIPTHVANQLTPIGEEWCGSSGLFLVEKWLNIFKVNLKDPKTTCFPLVAIDVFFKNRRNRKLQTVISSQISMAGPCWNWATKSGAWLSRDLGAVSYTQTTNVFEKNRLFKCWVNWIKDIGSSRLLHFRRFHSWVPEKLRCQLQPDRTSSKAVEELLLNLSRFSSMLIKYRKSEQLNCSHRGWLQDPYCLVVWNMNGLFSII